MRPFNARKKKARPFHGLLLCLCVIYVLLCSTTEAVAWIGKVVDKDTGEPVEGVAIIRSWYETIALPPHGYSNLLAVKETLTDKNGRFMIPAEFYIPVPIFRQVEERSTLIYKPGYKFLTLAKKTYTVRIEKVPTTYKARKAEADRADHSGYLDADETKLLREMLDREREFIEVLKSSEKSGPKIRRAVPRPVHPRKPERISKSAFDASLTKDGGMLNNGSEDFGEEIKKAYKVLNSTHIEFTADAPVTSTRRIDQMAPQVDLKAPDATEVLVESLGDGNPVTRYFAVTALRKIKDAGSLPYLIKATRDRNSYVRLEAVRTIGEMQDPSAVPALIDALRDRDIDVSHEAAKALCKFDDPRKIYAVKFLIEDLKDKSPFIKMRAEYALVQLGRPATELLIKALKNENVNIRRGAALALGKIGDPRAIDPLIELLKLNDKGSSWAAAMSLSNFREKRAANALVNALDFSKGYLRQRLVAGLCQVGPVAAGPMTAKLNDKDSNIRLIALNYFICIKDKRKNAFLIDALKDENARIRRSAAGKIAALKDPEFTDALISAWNDKDSEVRTRIADALALIGPAATGKLLVMLGDKNPYFRWRAARCLGKIRDRRAVDNLLLFLNDEVSAVKWSVIDALGEIGDVRAVEPLIAMLDDGDPGIRKKAAEALMQIRGR